MSNELDDIKRRAGIISEESHQSRYPELYSISEKIAQQVLEEISQRVPPVESKMPYKAQWVLEETIKILEAAV
jgi:hypothetical protein